MQWHFVQLHAENCHYIFWWRRHLMNSLAVCSADCEVCKCLYVSICRLRTEIYSGGLKLSVKYRKHVLNIPNKWTSLFLILVPITSLLHVSVWYTPSSGRVSYYPHNTVSCLLCVVCVTLGVLWSATHTICRHTAFCTMILHLDTGFSWSPCV